MSNPGKAIFSMLVLLTILTYIVYRSDVNVVDTKKESYNSAIQAASQVAAMEIMDTSDINKTYDGNITESQDIPINFESLNIFRSTLNRLLETKKSGTLGDISNINIPLVGFVTYDYVLGVTYGEAPKDINTFASLGISHEDYLEMDKAGKAEIDKKLAEISGTYLPPSGYTLYVDSTGRDELDGRTWRFTLGDVIFIPKATGTGSYNVADGRITIEEDKYKIESDTFLIKLLPNGKVDKESEPINISGYLSSIGFKTGHELRNYIVMASINEYLNAYTGVGFNKTSDNLQSALEFNLGKSNYSRNRSEYTSNSAVIEGPGLFAVIDLYKGTGENSRLYSRMTSFGGSELVQDLRGDTEIIERPR